MEQTKLLNYIDKISGILARKATFDIYDEDDIKQEIYFLILRAEESFDPDKGDEFTFYLNFAANRLKTFKRDKYALNKEKKDISDAASNAPESLDNISELNNEFNDLMASYKSIIDDRIAANIRADYLRFKDGARIPHRNKQIIIEHIKEIIKRDLNGQ